MLVVYMCAGMWYLLSLIEIKNAGEEGKMLIKVLEIESGSYEN